MPTILQLRLASRLKATGLSARAASLKAGLGPDAIRTVLKDRSRSPRGERLQALARALSCDVRYLLGETDELGEPQSGLKFGGFLRVEYDLAASVWRDAQDDLTTSYSRGLEGVPSDVAFSSLNQWMCYVADESMNRSVPKGYIVHVFSAESYDPQHSDLVVVLRTRAAGAFIERSLKRVDRKSTKGILLVEDSHFAQHSGQLDYPAAKGADETIDIAGYVVRAQRTFI